LIVAAQKPFFHSHTATQELPESDDRPWLRIAARKGVVGGREVEHLYHLGRFSIVKLCNSAAEDIEKYDIAEMNLVSAMGLPGAENLNIEAMLKLLDICARRCRAFIEQRIPRYKPSGRFDTLAKFRIGAMVEVLVRQLGVKYNPLIDDGTAGTVAKEITDPADRFIHGLLGPRRTGTCASLPVALIAVGRRLGYPLKWVLAPSHCFCRWDSPEEKFNIEYDECGVRFYSDEHYTHWPHEWDAKLWKSERTAPYYLISLTPQQELAHCAFNRAYQLNIVGGRRRLEAMATMQIAKKFWPCLVHGCWITHLAIKAFYPEQDWPLLPVFETYGHNAWMRLVSEKGALMLEAHRKGLI